MLPRPLGYAPLLPFAIAATVGLAVDRYLVALITPVWLAVAGVGLALGLLARRHELGHHLGLWVAAAGLAGAYHHAWRNDFPDDDIGHWAAIEPKLVRVRGTLAEEPSHRKSKSNPLAPSRGPDRWATVLECTEVGLDTGWAPASGRCRLTVEGALAELHVGDEVELVGMLTRPMPPLNPGERDYPSSLLNDRIRAELRVAKSADAVVRLTAGAWGVRRSLAAVRGWGERALRDSLGDHEGSVATALLLGDTAAMTTDEWDRYVRTGVVHVLAISGQHLVVLGAFLWFVLRLVGLRDRPAAVIVAAVLLGYALMTGGRPSALRAAVIAVAVCGAILMRVRALPANTFALAWIVVVMVNPTDPFTAGCQLSFVCVAVLIWGIPHWFPPRERTPLEQLIDESRSLPEQALRGLGRALGFMYLVTLTLGLATAPLTMYWQDLASPAGVIIGPAAMVITTVALIVGLVLMALWPIGLTGPLAWLTTQSLWLCDRVVTLGEHVPGGCWFVGRPPLWWVIGFYAILIVWLAAGGLARVRVEVPIPRWRFAVAVGVWSLVGLAAGSWRSPPDELVVTFLAVDHGTCVVIECPDGRVVLYDAGANSGPEVTRRRIAPFLWHRGIRRIDEVFLSHADADHFNGLPALMDRFRVGQITWTPTFREKPTPAVRVAIEAIEKRGVVVRQAQAGDAFQAGPVDLTVLHPSADGPEGVENVRSMVLLVRHRGHALLLTGDLEGIGIDQLMSRPAPAIDVLMAPHHGSAANRADALAEWARPRLVVSSQGRTDAGKAAEAYRRRGVSYWATWPEGAVSIRSHATGLSAETALTGQRLVVRMGVAPRSGEGGDGR